MYLNDYTCTWCGYAWFDKDETDAGAPCPTCTTFVKPAISVKDEQGERERDKPLQLFPPVGF